jgi:hypothetical protein
MTLKKLIPLSAVFFLPMAIGIFLSCERKTELFISEAIPDYLPVAVGKYITYRLDSTVFTNTGRTEEIHKYQVKHTVDAEVTDNLGRQSFRIIRHIRDSAGTQTWVENGTYFITPLSDQVEVVEDNLRFIKLRIPFKINTEWKGNRYLNTDPYSSLYNFNNDDNMFDWDYNYDQFDATATIGTQALKDVYTVLHIDESLNAPVTDTRIYGFKNYSIEKYAKNTGMVYREDVLWEYEPNTGNPGGGYKTGFGIKMWMIDHN